MSYQQFRNVVEAAGSYDDQSANVTRSVLVGRNVLEWTRRAASQAKKTRTDIFNDAVLLGSVRKLADRYGIRSYYEQVKSKKETELPAYVPYDVGNKPVKYTFQLAGFNERFVQHALSETNCQLEQITFDGVRILGGMARRANFTFNVSDPQRMELSPLKSLGISITAGRYWEVPLRADYNEVDPFE